MNGKLDALFTRSSEHHFQMPSFMQIASLLDNSGWDALPCAVWTGILVSVETIMTLYPKEERLKVLNIANQSGCPFEQSSVYQTL